MKQMFLAALMLYAPLFGFAQQSRRSDKLFTYPYTINDSPNGLYHFVIFVE